MELWIEKVISLFVLMAVSLIFGLLPIKLVNSFKRRKILAETMHCQRLESYASLQKAISYLNCVAGGVFLATSFLHLYPEIEEAATKMIDRMGSNFEFPIASFLIGCGLFLIMLVEHCVMQLQHHWSDIPYHSVESSFEESIGADVEPSAAKAKLESGSKSNYGTITDEISECQEKNKSPSALHSYLHRQLTSHSHGSRIADGPGHVTTEAQDECLHVIHTDHHEHHHINPAQLQGLRAFVLLLALSLHTVFEGMALGLQPTSALLWTLTGAICLHKAVIVFTMGLQFSEKLPNTSRVVLFIVLFSLMAPIGVAVGTTVGEVGSMDSVPTLIASVVLQGVATGTFIYVTFFEVLQKEVGQNHNVFKVLAVMAGYGVIAVMKLLLPEAD